MLIGAFTLICPVVNVMVPDTDGANVTVLGANRVLAIDTASRRLPAPLSLVLVTTKLDASAIKLAVTALLLCTLLK